MQCILPKRAGDTSVARKSGGSKKPNTERIYRCGICFTGFSRYVHCKAHEQLCESRNEHLHVCKYCLTLYGDELVLQRHIARKHNDGRFLCLQCGSNGKRYNSPSFLYKHVSCWHGLHSFFYCALCTNNCNDAKVFSSHAELEAHAQAVHQLCASEPRSDGGSSVADDTEDLEMLEENIEELLPIVDWDDDVQFGWPMGLSKEACILDDPKPSAYVCPVCGDGFTGSLSLLKHIDKQHESRNPLDCIYCAKHHKTREAVRSHMQRQHALLRPYICDVCQRDFATADHMQKHMQSQHSDKRPFACIKCGKHFMQLCHLKEHMETDKGHRTYVCALCDEQFFRRIDLERHVNSKHP